MFGLNIIILNVICGLCHCQLLLQLLLTCDECNMCMYRDCFIKYHKSNL